MSQYNSVETLSKTLQILKLMARDNGASITEISRETGIDRWTARDMVNRMESFSPDGRGLCIEEYTDPKDRRQTRYRVSKHNLWTATIPGINLNDEEALLLALMFNQGYQSPTLREATLELKKKLNMFKNYKEYEIINVHQARKIQTKETRKIILSILNAVQNDTCLSFTYKPVNRAETDYSVLPLVVFRYDGGFYLAAQKLPDGEFRIFGLERVLKISPPLSYDGELPERIDLSQRFNDPFGPFDHGDEFEATLKFNAFSGYFNAEKKWPDSVSIKKTEDGSVLMTAKTRSKTGLMRFILSYGPDIEVLGPEWLRTQIKERLYESWSLYAVCNHRLGGQECQNAE